MAVRSIKKAPAAQLAKGKNVLKSGLTLQERRLVMILRWWVGLFTTATIGFAFFPNQIILGLNISGHVFFNWPYRSLPLSSEHFWQIMSVSLLIVLTYLSYLAQKNIRENLFLVPLIIISKFATTAGFTLAFFLSGKYFAYLAGAVIDGFIFFVTWFCYHKIFTAQSRANFPSMQI